jgi:predicted nucleic acid-binding Zn ribbon protein
MIHGHRCEECGKPLDFDNCSDDAPLSMCEECEVYLNREEEE